MSMFFVAAGVVTVCRCFSLARWWFVCVTCVCVCVCVCCCGSGGGFHTYILKPCWSNVNSCNEVAAVTEVPVSGVPVCWSPCEEFPMHLLPPDKQKVQIKKEEEKGEQLYNDSRWQRWNPREETIQPYTPLPHLRYVFHYAIKVKRTGGGGGWQRVDSVTFKRGSSGIGYHTIHPRPGTYCHCQV